MKKSEAIALAAYVAGAYRNADTSQPALAVLADQVLDLEHETARGVVRAMVAAGGAFPPTPGEIRSAYFAALHRLPSVAAIVNAIAVARGAGRVEDAEYPHPIVREVVLEVGASRIHEDWTFAHREVGDVAERLHREFLCAVNLASLTGCAPNLSGRLALIARGIDPYQEPASPALPDGWTFHGWRLDHAEQRWAGHASGPRAGDWRRYECPMLYLDVDTARLSALPVGGAGPLSLPAGTWTPPAVTYFGTTHEQTHGPYVPRPRATPRPIHQVAAPTRRDLTPAELDARRAEAIRVLRPDAAKGGAA